MSYNPKMKKGATLDIIQRLSPTPHVPQVTCSMGKVMHIFALFGLDSDSREHHQAKLRNAYNFRCALGPASLALQRNIFRC